jgi:drug/metabolite transporter (DMT)-like permease
MDLYTFLGILAIIFWSSNVAFSRSLAEQIGPISSGAITFTIAGILACLYVYISTGNFKNIFNLPKLYLVVCGSLFVTSTISLSLAVGFSIQREQVLTVGLINYLWPGISLFFSVLLLHRKANIWLFLGILSAFAGIWISTISNNNNSLVSELLGFQSSLPVVLAFIAALTWGLYSNVSRKWSFQLEAYQGLAGVPLFLLAAGLILPVFVYGFLKKRIFLSTLHATLA